MVDFSHGLWFGHMINRYGIHNKYFALFTSSIVHRTKGVMYLDVLIGVYYDRGRGKEDATRRQTLR